MQRLALLFGGITVTITFCVSSEVAFDKSSNNDANEDISKRTGEYDYNKGDRREWSDYYKAEKPYDLYGAYSNIGMYL